MESKSTVRAAKTLLVAGGLLVLGIVVGFTIAGQWHGQPVLQAREAAPASAVQSGLESPFTQIADHILPAVVAIDVKRTVEGGGAGSFHFEGPYGDFFRRLFPEAPDTPRRQMNIPSSGSGFIIDKEGHVLTNNHVVRDASDINVTLNDRRKFKARIIGSDPGTDVAIIKLEDDGPLPTVPLGDSDEIRIGDWAIAIGNALGELEGTLTVGVISAKGRTNLSIAGGQAPSYQDFIQTDASINFGNSGGPLLNIRGEAIGINTAINPSGSGIGFAIPINLAKRISEQLIASGKVVRGYLGILPGELTPELAEMWGLKNLDGIVVQSVSGQTPAADAGLRVKDVITQFDGKKVDDVQQFRLLVAETPIKKRVKMQVLRSGQKQDLYVTLAERPSEDQLGQVQRAPQSWLGIDIAPVRGDAAEGFGVDEKEGVVITRVGRGTGASAAGLQPGDIIKELNDSPVKDVFDYNAAVEKARSKDPRKPVVLLIKRGGTTQFVAVEPDEE